MRTHTILGTLLLAGLTACSTVTTGTTQAIYIDTPKMSGAKCNLVDSKGGRWSLAQSPGPVTVNKGDGPMTITCTAEGFERAVITTDEEIVGATFGSILIGGGIGFLVDAASGAAQKYPDNLVIWMKPEEFDSSKAEAAWLSDKRDFEITTAMNVAREACQQQSNMVDCDEGAVDVGLQACRANGGEHCSSHPLLKPVS